MTITRLTGNAAIYDEVGRIENNRRAVRAWLFIVLLALFALVLVGGVPRG